MKRHFSEIENLNLMGLDYQERKVVFIGSSFLQEIRNTDLTHSDLDRYNGCDIIGMYERNLVIAPNERHRYEVGSLFRKRYFKNFKIDIKIPVWSSFNMTYLEYYGAKLLKPVVYALTKSPFVSYDTIVGLNAASDILKPKAHSTDSLVNDKCLLFKVFVYKRYNYDSQKGGIDVIKFRSRRYDSNSDPDFDLFEIDRDRSYYFRRPEDFLGVYDIRVPTSSPSSLTIDIKKEFSLEQDQNLYLLFVLVTARSLQNKIQYPDFRVIFNVDYTEVVPY